MYRIKTPKLCEHSIFVVLCVSMNGEERRRGVKGKGGGVIIWVSIQGQLTKSWPFHAIMTDFDKGDRNLNAVVVFTNQCACAEQDVPLAFS